MLNIDDELSHVDTDMKSKTDDDGDSTQDLVKFFKQFIHYAQWKCMRRFITGSTVEIRHRLFLVTQHVTCDMSDMDVMHYDSFRLATKRSGSYPDTYCGAGIRIYTDDVHAGYVRLIKESSNTELLLSDLYTLKDDEKPH